MTEDEIAIEVDDMLSKRIPRASGIQPFSYEGWGLSMVNWTQSDGIRHLAEDVTKHILAALRQRAPQ